MIVNFDNAATTFPKPPEVRLAVEKAAARYGSAGRGGHPIAARTSDLVYCARETAAEFFGAEPENVVFTLNCTHALNLAIQGLAEGGGHFVISSLEHNSVLRPVYALAQKGRIRFSIAKVHAHAQDTVESFRAQLRPDTRAVICTIASNVTGQILPWKEIGAMCQARGICMVADGAQACGILPVKLTDGINILCTAGHKGLYGITGTGMLITDGKFPLLPLMQGGTGSLSSQPEQPDFLPDALESGTLNVIGAASVKAGIEFVQKKGIQHLFRMESALCELLKTRLSAVPEVIVYRSPHAEYVPILSFSIRGMSSEETAARLAEQGFCLRAGMHCAPLAHHALGTQDGAVRFAPSAFSRMQDVQRLAEAVRVITSEKSKK